MAKELTEIEKKNQEVMIEKDAYDLTNYWQERNTQFKIDRDIINLVKPKKETSDKVKWMSNEPKVFFDTSRALVSLNAPRFRLPIPMNYSPEEKEKMNKAERFVIGIWRTLDQQIADRGAVSWLYDLAYWVLLGWYAVFSIVKKTSEGIQFLADIYDPITVYPEWDKEGLSKCVRAYEIDKITAEEMALDFQEKGLDFVYQEPKEGAKYNIINYWRKDGKKIFNAIMLNGILVKPMTLQRNLNRIPIHIGAIGSPDRISEGNQGRRGESIVAANRDMFEYDNIMISLMATILASQAYPNIIEKTRTGQEAHKGEEFTGFGTKLTYKIEDQIELLRNATTPQEANILLQYVSQQRQKGGIPNVTYGGVVQDVSGFALSQYLSALKYKLGTSLNAMQFCVSRIMTDFLYQYKTGNFGKIELSTENPYDMRRGMSYIEEFSKDDVPERIYVEVTIPITSQFDKTQAILNSVQSLNSGLLSRETLWETMLDVQDAEQEKERLREDQMFRDPFIMDMETIERMWARVEFYIAKGKPVYAEALKRYIQMKEMQIGLRQGIVEKPGVGVPPQQMPSEARESPDQLRAMRGIPPSGLNRPPQTPEQRAASVGKKGVLVAPDGTSIL